MGQTIGKAPMAAPEVAHLANREYSSTLYLVVCFSLGFCYEYDTITAVQSTCRRDA